MKAQVDKKWWQFWLPKEVDIELPAPLLPDYIRQPMEDLREVNDRGVLGDIVGPSAIEADEAEPWYGGDAVEDEDSSVVTAEPPVVYANRGNARMEERKQARERQQ